MLGDIEVAGYKPEMIFMNYAYTVDDKNNLLTDEGNAHLVEERTGQKVGRMHLYYTGEENSNPMISYPYTKTAVDGTIAAFDDTVHKILRKEYSHRAINTKTCEDCDFRFYCFDSLPERECFWQYIKSGKVKEVYFTGMFTANQGDLAIQYYDPESGRVRQYYPDFLAKMDDGSYHLIEVKGDNKIDDAVVKAKAAAAREMAMASGVEYKMYTGSMVMKSRILDQ